MSNLDKERKSWFEIFRSWLVFNLEWRSNKINSVVDGALFFSRRFLDHISFHLKTTSFREPNKARNCLDVINSEYKISLSSLQLKRKQASLLTDTHFSILKFTSRFVTLITSRSSHDKFRYTRLTTSRLIETLVYQILPVGLRACQPKTLACVFPPTTSLHEPSLQHLFRTYSYKKL